MRLHHLFFLIALAALLTPETATQDLYTTDTRPARGFMPTADQVNSPVDSIDPVSGKLHVQIPLGSLPRGRAGLGFDLDLVYDSHIYDVLPRIENGIPTPGNPNPPPREIEELVPHTAGGGWTYNVNNYRVELEQHAACSTAGYLQWRLRVGLPDGSLHIMHLKGFDNETVTAYTGDAFFEIRPDGSKDPCGTNPAFPFVSSTLTYYSADASYLKLEFNPTGVSEDWTKMTWRLYFPDGRRVVFNGLDSPPGTPLGSIYIYDPNGNTVRLFNVCYNVPVGCAQPYTAIVDDADRSVQIDYSVESTAIRKRDRVTALSPGGATGLMQWYVDWKAMHIGGVAEGRRYQWTFDPPELELQQTKLVSWVFWVVEYVYLPLSNPAALGSPPQQEWNSYAFGYSDNADDGYGELDDIRMPSGAQYHYEYKYAGGPIGPPWPPTELLAHDNSVKEKEITHDSVTDMRWTYTFDADTSIFTNENGGAAVWQTKYIYAYGKNNPNDWRSGLVTRIEEPHGAVRKREWQQNKTYGLRLAGAYKTPNNPYIKRESVTDGTTAGTSSTKTAVTEFAMDKNGNPLTRTSFDWVTYAGLFVVETGSAIRRQTSMTYHVSMPDASVIPATATDYPDAYWQPHNPAYWSSTDPRRLDAVKRQTVSPDGSAIHALTEYVYDNPRTTGNVTEERRWDSVKLATPPSPVQALLPQHAQVLQRSYDTHGNVTDIYAPEVRTRLTYPPHGAIPEGFLLGSADHAYGSPEQRSWQFTWNSNGTAVITKKDVDNNIQTGFNYDIIGRQIMADEAGVRQTATIFDDIGRKVTVKRDLFGIADGKLETITRYDELGRVKLVQTTDGQPLSSEASGIQVSTTYIPAAEGLRIVSSTPYRTTLDTTLEWTCVQYDRLGRVAVTAMFTGATPPTDCTATSSRTGRTDTQYLDDVTTTMEWSPPTNRVRNLRRDALGRLVEVIEDPGTTPALNYATTYMYDALDNLTKVTQGVQTRRFTYSSLSRLLSAKHPEMNASSACGLDPSGQPISVCYTYNDSGNLLKRTDARNIETTLTYDALHRLQTKSYSDGTPTATYTYYVSGEGPPRIGQLKSVSSSAASTTYNSYTALGQIAASTHTINGYGGNLAFGYTWFVNDALQQLTYPSGRVVDYQVDDAGRTKKVSAGPTTYADMTAIEIPNPYAPDGRLAKVKLGNGLYDTREFQTPGTTTRYRLGTTAGGAERLRLDYNFHATLNNGNLLSHGITNSGGSWTQNFTYDNVNRLATAVETGGYSQTLNYDQYGNGWVVGGTNISPVDVHEPTVSMNFDPATNRLLVQGSNYDAAGNQTFYTPYSLSYDAENRNTAMTSSLGNLTMIYDGDGRRVKKIWTANGVSAVTTFYLYDATGGLAAEYSTAPPMTGTFYTFTDILGSVRAVANSTGTLTECYDYLPFGRMLGRADNNRTAAGCYPDMFQSLNSKLPQKFTGKERDAESGLDFFGARYYSGAQGRFTSPDAPFADQHVENPQSWNLYQYGYNNPLANIDIDGRSVWTKVAKVAVQLVKSGNAAAAFAGNVQDFRTLIDANASFGSRALAFGSLASEVLPVSIGDLKDAGRLLGVIDNAVDANRLVTKTDNVADAVSGAKRGPGFVVTEAGEAIPVPAGATGPSPVRTGKGFQFQEGQGGPGLDPKVTGVRVMDPTAPKGPSPGYPGGYVVYNNKTGLAVNPQTGRTVPNSDPSRHIPLRPKKACPTEGETGCP